MPTQPFAVPAVIMFVVAVPLLFGLVPRNRYYGFRTRKTLSDDSIWYPANRMAGAAMMMASGLYGAVALVWPYNRAASDFGVWLLHLAAFLVPIFLGLGLAAWRFGK